MFDIGFSELLLIFIVGLVVLGPQRMPVAIRTVMKWVRMIRGLAANVQNELAQELKLQELQESIKKAEHLNLNALSPELAETVQDLKQSAEKMKAELDKQASVANHSLQEQIEIVRNENYQANQQNTSETAENSTALDNAETVDDELAENIEHELSLDEQLAQYIDQYHPAEDAQPVSQQEKKS
ncbi:Sec-independent protein translocase protein TatB [Lonepinella sp. BR2474]|uniref:Sec-independent protein translocase protein TatB n=1 Tax=Lonepinella sp. BR2474 TaxID=3434548 RepID=UPI003F6DF92E